MNLTEYNAMPEGDLKLAVRLAITMGWIVDINYSITEGDARVFVTDPDGDGYFSSLFNPFTDTSIPYGLIGRGVKRIYVADYGKSLVTSTNYKLSESYSKTHAILNAFCAADPSGHWATFLKGE